MKQKESHFRAREHGGGTPVGTQPHADTTFEVSPPPAEALLPESSRRPRVSQETVLVVEDNAPLRKVMCRVLGSAGYNVLAASGGSEAIALAAAHAGEIHLLLTDVVMRDMGGDAVAERLIESRVALRVVFTSGYDGAGITAQGVVHPGVPFLPKPFTPKALLECVREVLAEP